MQTISGTLAAAVRAAVRKPYARVQIFNRFLNAGRLAAVAWYTGAETVGPHAAAVPTDGSLVRLRVDGTTLYRSRVVAPVIGSDYSIWTSWRLNTSLCAIARSGATLVAFAVDSAAPTQIHLSTSTDNGATWSAFGLAVTHSASVTAIAAGAESGTAYVVIVNNGGNLSAYRWNGTAWSAAVTTTDGLITANGIACAFNGNYDVVVTGALGPGGSRLSTRYYTGTAWSAAVVVLESAALSNVSYSAPFLAHPYSRLTFREVYSGTGAYDRILVARYVGTMGSTAMTSDAWTEPVPFNLSAAYGLALSGVSGGAVHLTTARHVYAWDTALLTLDVTADVLSIDCDDRGGEPGRTVVRLVNADGAYNVPGAGAIGALTRGSEVQIAAGYTTTAGAEVAGVRHGWISSIEHDFVSSPPTVVLTLLSLAGVLGEWKSARAMVFAAQTMSAVLTLVLARAGIAVTYATASAQVTSLIPNVAVPAGSSGLAAARLLLARVPDVLYALGGAFVCHEPLAAEAADAAFFWRGNPATDFPVQAARYVDELKPVTHVRVLGGPLADVVGESIDYAESVYFYGAPRVLADRDATTAALAGDRAASVARDIEIASRGDTVQIPVHPGVEVQDVVALTDSRVGLSAAKRRVLAVRTRYERRPGKAVRYDQELTLGEP